MRFSSDKILKYLAIFWNAVNLRFRLISDPKIELTIAAAIIIKDPSEQPYFEKAKVNSGGKTYLEFAQALTSLAEYLYKNEDTFPKHDLVMVMTGEDLATDDEDGVYDNTYTGIAIVGGACTLEPENNISLSAGIAEDVAPFYDGVLFTAHETAHLLGAVHDGDPPAEHLPGSPGAEDCPFSQGYLMSYKIGTKRRLHWSNCTINQIKWFLNTSQAACLHSRQNTKTPMHLNSLLPGQLVSLDNQCAFYGPRTIHYANQEKYSICTNLVCITPGLLGGMKSKGPALEGTPCGYTSDRWCINGDCVRRE